ncbi:MAG: hypothetical protein AB7Q45_10185 [Planctomycetaceae bacterium]
MKRQLAALFGALRLWIMLCGFALLAGCGSGQQESSSAPPAPAQLPRIDKHAAIDAENDPPVAAPPAANAPFDLSYLDANTELFVLARPGAIVGSQFVKTLAGGNLGQLNEFKEAIGIGIEQVETVTVGVRNLQKFAEQSRPPIGGGPMGFAASRSAMPSPLDAAEDTIVVVRTIQPVTAQALGLIEPGGDSEERIHQSKPYYPLPAGAAPQPYLYIANEKTLIIAAESSIKKVIEQGAKITSPPVDLSFIPTVPDVVLAVVPKDHKALFAAAPDFSVGSIGPAAGSLNPGPGIGSFGPNSADAPPAPGTGKSFSLLGNEEEDDDPRGGIVAPPPSVVAPRAAEEDISALLATHAEAVALLLDFDADVKLDVAVRCDSPASAAKVRAVLAKTVTSGKAAFESSRDTLPGVIQQVAEAVLNTLSTGGSNQAVTLTATLPESQLTNLPLLPVAVMGMMMASSMSMQDMDAMVDWRERAQEVIDQGHPPASTESLPAGLELRALARWGVPPQGGDAAAAPLEVAIVASGELATRAVAFGQLNLAEVNVGNGPRLKWLGAAHTAMGENPVREFVPIDREGFFSRHPAEGFATGYAFAPTGNLPSTLSAIAGGFTLSVATNVRDVTLNPLPTLGRTVNDETLRAAGFSASTATANGISAVTLTYNDTTAIGKIELLDAAGNPVNSSGWSQAKFGGQVQRSIQLPANVDPAQLGVRVSVSEDVEQVPVTFRFENLPLPEPQDVSADQRALAMWLPGERVSGELSEGLIVEAQARWPSPQMSSSSSPLGGLANNPFGGATGAPAAGAGPLLGGGFSGGGDDDDRRDRGRGSRRSRKADDEDADGGGGLTGNAAPLPGAPTGLSGLSGNDEDDLPAFGGALGSGAFTVNADTSLQLAVDLTGPLARSIVAVGNLDVDTAESADGIGLSHTGSLYGTSALTDRWADVGRDAASSPDQPPDGLRVLVLFAPPEPPIQNISRFRGELQIRSAREQVEFVVNNLNDRANRRIKDRNLSKYGLEIAVLIEENQLMFRLLEGAEERISEMHPVDRDGARIANIVQSTTLDNGNLIHRFEFPGRVPARVGLEFSINVGVQEITVPLRFHDVPVPPRPVGVESLPGTGVPAFPPSAPVPNQPLPGASKGSSATDS